MGWSRWALPSLVAAALGQATPCRAQAADPRSDLEVVARALDRAVSRVSHPVGWAMIPEGDTLGYHVAGVGAIFVVAPRAVPAHTALPPPDSGAALSRVMRVVDQTLQQAESPETRERLQKTLDGLRRQQEELAVRAAAQERDRAAIQKLTEERLARRAREAAQGVAPDGRQRVKDAAAAEEALRNFEAEAAAFQREAEAARQAADDALAELAREMRQRLAGSGAPSPEAPLAGPGQPPAPSFVAPPPWRYWVGPEPPREERPVAVVLGQVREAVTGVLESQGLALRAVAPQDLVLVTVDFVPQGSVRLRMRPERTLVVRVRKKELEERASGALGAEALRQRIEYLEY